MMVLHILHYIINILNRHMNFFMIKKLALKFLSFSDVFDKVNMYFLKSCTIYTGV